MREMEPIIKEMCEKSKLNYCVKGKDLEEMGAINREECHPFYDYRIGGWIWVDINEVKKIQNEVAKYLSTYADTDGDEHICIKRKDASDKMDTDNLMKNAIDAMKKYTNDNRGMHSSYTQSFINGYNDGVDRTVDSITPERIIFNPPATIVFWSDGEKTVVKCTKNCAFNPYYGFCAALAKRVFGNNSQVNHIVNSGIYTDTAKKSKKEEKSVSKDNESEKITEETETESSVTPKTLLKKTTTKTKTKKGTTKK